MLALTEQAYHRLPAMTGFRGHHCIQNYVLPEEADVIYGKVPKVSWYATKGL